MRVRYTRLALDDLEAIERLTTEIRDSEAARVVVGLVQNAIEVQLRRFPELGRPVLVEDTREFVLSQLGVVITYQVEEEVLWILSILHGSHGRGRGSRASARGLNKRNRCLRLAITHIFPCGINGLLAILKIVFFRAEPFKRPYLV
jgi:plasmid stabilization system protein ParE